MTGELLNSGLEEFAENQQKVLELKALKNDGLSQFNHIIELLKKIHIPDRDVSQPIQTLQELLFLVVHQHSAYEKEVDEHCYPIVRDFLAIALDAYGYTEEAAAIKNLKPQKGILPGMVLYQYLSQRGFDSDHRFSKITLDDVGKKVASQMQKMASELERNVQNVVYNMDYVGPQTESMRRETEDFLVGRWYNPQAVTASKVASTKEIYEASSAKDAIDARVVLINSTPEQRIYTTGQINAINAAYQKTFQHNYFSALNNIGSSAKKFLSMENPGEKIGNANRAYNAQLGKVTPTEAKITQGLKEFHTVFPNAKEEFKNQVSIIPDVKNSSKFWHGITKLLHSLEQPFKKWLENKQQQTQTKPYASPP